MLACLLARLLGCLPARLLASGLACLLALLSACRVRSGTWGKSQSFSLVTSVATSLTASKGPLRKRVSGGVDGPFVRVGFGGVGAGGGGDKVEVVVDLLLVFAVIGGLAVFGVGGGLAVFVGGATVCVFVLALFALLVVML